MKHKGADIFKPYDLKQWESSDGVNFAVALARLTGWLLHVDWWTPTDDMENEDNMKSLRVYVADNCDEIYDLTGKKSIDSFSRNIIGPLVKNRALKGGGVLTRFYSEEKLLTLPLRVLPNEKRIQDAMQLISKNATFLDKIPIRIQPYIPASIAANFSFGHCNPFASALGDLKGYKVVGLSARKYTVQFGYSKLGYFHSAAQCDNGNLIDVWGTQSIERVTKRYGVVEYDIDEMLHLEVRQKQWQSNPALYDDLYRQSAELIAKYF